MHDPRSGRIENTRPAFIAAMAKGYGIECDLQAAKDGTPVVFHDERLDRLVEAAGPVRDLSAASLARLHYRGTNESILTFAQLLELVAGQVPLLIEVKRNRRRPPDAFLEKIAQAALAYGEPIALMSFDPGTVAALGRLAPAVPRGLIAGSHQLLAGWLTRPARPGRVSPVARLLASAPEGISFFALDVKLLPTAAPWLARNHPELPLFTWTVRTPRERRAAQRWADAPIFEGYEA